MSDEQAVVGIDVGKYRLAASWPWWETVRSIDLRKPNPRRDVELRQLQDWVGDNIADGAHLWIDKGFAGNGSRAGASVGQWLSETIAAVLTAKTWLHPPQVVHSATWKLAVVGNHVAGKDEMAVWLQEHHPVLFKRCSTEDEVDATIIGLYGTGRETGLYLPPEPRPKRRRKT